MPAPALVAETGTLAAGVVTVAGAVAGYRTFAAALTDGDSVDVVLRDSDGEQASYPASAWDETAGTITLGTVDVASGTMNTSGAVTIWAASDVPMSEAEALAGTETTPRTIAANVLDAALAASRPLTGIVTGASGNLTVADHNARWVVTSGNVVVPHASGSKGFYCEIQAGGAHTVTFNSTASAAMATGDIMTVYVTDDASGTPTIKAVLTEAANLVAFA